MFKSFASVLLVFLSLGSYVFAQNVEHIILSNGMEVYVIPDHSAPLVAHVLLYKVGAANEQPGKSGLAHLLEHVMFRSTKGNKDVSKTLQNLGGYFNAFTSSYFTVYYEIIHKKNLPDVMKLEADRMSNLDFPENLFALERKIVLEERKMRIDNLPKTRLLEEMQAAFYRNDKSWQVAGWEHEINQITKEDAQHIYNSFYAPNNALLIISGDTTLKEVEPLLSKYYEKISSVKQKEDPLVVTEPLHRADITVNFADSKVKEQEIVYFFGAPNFHDSSSLALIIGNYILGLGETSRLYQALVINDFVANYVQSDYDPFMKSDSILSIEVLPNEKVLFEKVEAKVKAVIDELITNGITEEELEIAKSDFKMELIQTQDGPTKKGIFMATNLGMGLSADYVRELPNLIKNITVSEVNDALKSVFKEKKSVKGYLLNSSSVRVK